MCPVGARHAQARSRSGTSDALGNELSHELEVPMSQSYANSASFDSIAPVANSCRSTVLPAAVKLQSPVEPLRRRRDEAERFERIVFIGLLIAYLPIVYGLVAIFIH